jgi:transcription antitermination factor NusG
MIMDSFVIRCPASSADHISYILQEAGIEAFNPKTQTSADSVAVHLFPGYLFVGVVYFARVMQQKIRYRLPMAFLLSGTELGVVRASELDAVRKDQEDRLMGAVTPDSVRAVWRGAVLDVVMSNCRVGDDVTVCDGLFQGYTGTVEDVASAGVKVRMAAGHTVILSHRDVERTCSMGAASAHAGG